MDLQADEDMLEQAIQAAQVADVDDQAGHGTPRWQCFSRASGTHLPRPPKLRRMIVGLLGWVVGPKMAPKVLDQTQIGDRYQAERDPNGPVWCGNIHQCRLKFQVTCIALCHILGDKARARKFHDDEF